MIGIVVVTHGQLATEFKAALEHVVGPQEQLETITIGPAAGAPDSLSDAVGSWRAAQWLEPGATMVWTVRYRANPRPS